MNINYLFLVALIFSLVSCTQKTNDFHVSPTGNDDNPGTKSQPFLSFTKAKESVAQVIARGAENREINIYFRGGTYSFDQTVVIKGEEFSPGSNKITFSSFQDEEPVFSAGKILVGWKKVEGKIPYLPEIAKGKVWETNIPENESGQIARFLCTDSIPLINAVSEDFTTSESDSMSKTTIDFFGANYKFPEEYSSFMFPKNSLREWSNLNDIEIIARPHYGWVVNILQLESINYKENIAHTTIPATYFIRKLSGSGDDANPNMRVQNAIDYLDEPGEWVINSKEGKIYYWPKEGGPSTVFYPLLQELIRLEGNEKDGNIVKNIVFKGITFTHGNRDVWDRDAIGLQHDWALYDESDALLRFIDTEGCIVDNCTFSTSGGGGVRFDFYSQRNKVINSKFNNLGGTPILLSGYGPGIKDVNINNEIINNEIHDFGQSYSHSPGIFIWQSGSNKIAHNLVYNTPYNGIVISGPRPQFFNRWIGDRRELTGTVNFKEIGWIADEEWNSSLTYIEEWDKLFPYLFSGNNIIEYNDIHDVMQVLDDGNAIYLSGTGYNNIVRKNYVHHNTSPHRQGGVRADDYARDITISENIIYKFARYGIDTKYDSYVSNNYIIDYVPTEKVNGEKFDPISFFYISACGPIKGCVGKKNIYYQSTGQSQPFVKVNLSRSILKTLPEFPRLSDCKIDSNIYYGVDIYQSCLDQLEALRNQGVDSSSVVADPLFEGLEEAGFKLKENSPAFKLRIKQIDFENIGLLKE